MFLGLHIALLNDLADDFERDAIGEDGFASELIGQAGAFEGIADDFLAEAWKVCYELEASPEEGLSSDARARVINWLRD